MKNDEVQMWLMFASEDLKHAEKTFREDGFMPHVIFHSHEAVEKYYKALIRHQGNTFPYVHNLDLIAEVIVCSKEDKNTLINVGMALDKIYHYSRYPSDSLPSKKEGGNALKEAQRAEKIILKYFAEETP